MFALRFAARVWFVLEDRDRGSGIGDRGSGIGIGRYILPTVLVFAVEIRKT